jgi:hypothetical protein
MTNVMGQMGHTLATFVQGGGGHRGGRSLEDWDDSRSPFSRGGGAGWSAQMRMPGPSFDQIHPASSQHSQQLQRIYADALPPRGSFMSAADTTQSSSLVPFNAGAASQYGGAGAGHYYGSGGGGGGAAAGQYYGSGGGGGGAAAGQYYGSGGGGGGAAAGQYYGSGGGGLQNAVEDIAVAIVQAIKREQAGGGGR